MAATPDGSRTDPGDGEDRGDWEDRTRTDAWTSGDARAAGSEVEEHARAPVYAFTISEAQRVPLMGVQFEPVVQLEVDPARAGMAALSRRLRGWALEELRSRGFDLGLYVAELATLDEEGYPDRLFGHHYIAWSGERVLDAR